MTPGPVRGRLTLLAVIGAGGAIGTSARYGTALVIPPRPGAYPVAMLYGLDIENRWPDWLRAVTHTGLIGAYTTYSTWAVDCLALTRGGAGRSAVVNLAGSLAGGVLLAWTGASIGAAV